MAYQVVNGKMVKIAKQKTKPSVYRSHVDTVSARLSEELKQDRMGTRERHEYMYEKAANNPRKGKKGGDCNVTQCQRPGASCYNPPMRAWYCHSCASDIRRVSLSHNEEPFIQAEHIKPDYYYDEQGNVRV